MNPFDQQKPIPGIKNILIIGSGKGGVGKSTVTLNLAAAFQQSGLKVGVLDADLYGPSLPRMTGTLNQKPEIREDKKIVPLQRMGMKLMSIGHLIDESQAVIWRGPMLFKALDQFFHDVDWGDLDVLLIDLPPGTGDVALTIAQKVPVTGALCVCTPQNMALADAKKAIDMFQKTDIPIFGVIENMSYFLLSEGAEPVALFPRGDLDAYLDSRDIKKLASLPFSHGIALSSESGIPTVLSDDKSQVASDFMTIAKQITARFN